MKSVDTQLPDLKANPYEINGYLVYGQFRESPSDAGRFEAWYWIDVAGDPPERVVGPSRYSSDTFEGSGLAEVMGAEYGAAIARQLAPR